jgi:hypothetical protein
MDWQPETSALWTAVMSAMGSGTTSCPTTSQASATAASTAGHTATTGRTRTLARPAPWWRRIESGQAKSITDLAEQEGVTDAYVCRLLPLTCLAPGRRGHPRGAAAEGA